MSSEKLKVRPFEEMEHHPVADKLATILCDRTQNTNPLFFRVLVAYYFSVVASMMRCSITTHDRGQIPVNLYAINLATSGAGKGMSTNLMEDQVIHQFRQRFTEETFEILAEDNLPKVALRRAKRKQTDPDAELEKVNQEFDAQGPLLFSFDNGTEAAIKQTRHKLMLANAGSMNLQIDEIGSNLSGSIEALNAYLELYDVGKIKQKLVKNTKENIRNEDIQGKTPTNMMLFGTPAKLLNGGKAEEEFYSMLETGYARRCFFGYAKGHERNTNMSVDDVYSLLTSDTSHDYLDDISDHFENLADIINVGKKLVMSEYVAKLFIAYKLDCERRAEEFTEYEEMQKAELSHRYFKAMKLAGAYAFVDDSPEVTVDNFEQAVKLAEESGRSFLMLLERDKPYMKLANYIAQLGKDVTHADLVDDLPFYPKVASQRNDMLTLAIAHGYKNNIIIKKSFSDGIEFLRGETLQPTDLDKVHISYSDDIATGYVNASDKFENLHNLIEAPGMHWVNHYLKGGHRNEENAIPGFNLVVIDVDHGVSLSVAKNLLKDYRALYYTTKRHTDAENRFRIILPINYELKLDAKDFKEFMHNIYEWLPFEVDTATAQRSRKWLTQPGHHEYTDGILLDALPFIPKTSKNEERRNLVDSQQSLDNLERWVINNTGDGNRNNQLLKYAYILIDANFDFDQIRQRVSELNNKIPDKLDESEIMGTIMVTASKALAKRES